MEKFSITNGIDFVKVSVEDVISDSTDKFGGYNIKCSVNIYSDGFSAQGEHWNRTGYLCKLYDDLLKANRILRGEVIFDGGYEQDLQFTLSYDDLGHVNVVGEYSKFGNNKLEFAFQTDQSFISQTLRQLAEIARICG